MLRLNPQLMYNSSVSKPEEIGMQTIPIEQAQAQLPALIHGLKPGEEIVITVDDRPAARLIGEPKPNRKPRVAGSAIGILTILSDDDEHLKDFPS